MNTSAVEQAEKREQAAAEGAEQGESAPGQSEAQSENGRAGGAEKSGGGARKPVRKSKPGIKRLEAWMSRMSARFPFWQRLSSMLFLPYAFRSGIKMKPLDANANAFTAVLPFKRFNRNWYNAMAGGALLANSEIAAGMYLFGECGGGYSIVCKHLEYNFLRPCFGPAIYRVTPREDIKALLESGKEFNITLDINVVQQLPNRKGRDRRVGRSEATFYATPKSLRTVNRGKGKAPRRKPGEKGRGERSAEQGAERGGGEAGAPAS